MGTHTHPAGPNGPIGHTAPNAIDGPMPDPVIIVGAGLTGLTLAWRLRREGRSVVVLEASERAGGVLRSERIDGVLVEHAAQSFRGSQTPPWELVTSLGLQDQVVAASPSAAHRFLLRHGALHPLNRSMLRSGTPLRRRELLRAVTEALRPGASAPNETVHAFFRRRFGCAVADELADAVMAGISGGDPRELEMRTAFAPLWELEQSHGSVIRGMLRREKTQLPEGLPRVSWTFRDGLQTLTDALQAALGDVVRLNTPVTGLWPNGDGWRVDTPRGPLNAEQVVLTCPAHAALPWLGELSDVLGAMPTAPIAAVHLGWKKGRVQAPTGFGWLTSSAERHDVLGCIWVSSSFPQHAPDHDVVRLMIGGRRAPSLAAMSSEALVAHATSIIAEVQGLDATPDLTHVARHPAGIPQYTVGHHARVQELAEAWPGLSFMGWGYSGVALHHSVQAALSWTE